MGRPEVANVRGSSVPATGGTIKDTAGAAKGSRVSDTVTDEATDTRVWEYVTYAPKGARCSACKEVIKPLEPVRRGHEDRTSGPPAVIYRHTDSDECPGQAVTA